MKKLFNPLYNTVWFQPCVVLIVSFAFFFIFTHNGLIFILDLILPFLLLPWMIRVSASLLQQRKYVKAIIVIMVNLLSVGIFWLFPYIFLAGYLPKYEGSVMDEKSSKDFGIHIATYSCLNDCVLDSIYLKPVLWTQFSNDYVNLQNKEEIIVYPKFICYSCRFSDEDNFQKMVKAGYNVNWPRYYYTDDNGCRYSFVKFGVNAADVKDTITMYLKTTEPPYHIIDSLTFIRSTDTNIPDWSNNLEEHHRYISRSMKENFLDKIYYRYFWSEIIH